MNRRAGLIWLIAGFLLALIAGFLTFRTLSVATARATLASDQVPTEPAVVAVRTIPVNHLISAEDIALRDVPTDLIPEGAVRTLESALGRISRTELHSGEILLESRLVHPDKVVNEDLAFAIPKGHVVIAMPPTDLMSTLGLLKPGDRVDFLVSLEVPSELSDAGESTNSSTGTNLVTVDAMQNLEITAVAVGSLPQADTQGNFGLGESAPEASVQFNMPKALLFAVKPQEALILKHAIDSGGIIDLALRAPDDDQFVETDPVTLRYLSDLYRMDIPVAPAPLGETSK